MKIGIQNLPSNVNLPYRDGVNPVRILTCEMTDSKDLQEVEWYNQSGVDAAPPIGSRILIVEIGDDWKIGFAIDDGLAKEVLDGERETYATDGSQRLSRIKQVIDGSIEIEGGSVSVLPSLIKLNVDGSIEINGNADNAVRYSELEKSFNDLQSKYNDLVTVFLAHVHNDSLGAPTTPPTPGIPPNPIASPSTAQIILAKIDEVKMP